MPEPEQVQLRSPMPGMPGPISSTQVQLEVLGQSAAAMVELSWSHWPLYRVLGEPSTESADSHHQSCHSSRSRSHPPVVHQAAPPLSLQCP